VGNWLSAEQGRRLLLTAAGSSLRAKRDYATLAILLGWCGLRRAESAFTQKAEFEPYRFR
jgi:hypothetical protein